MRAAIVLLGLLFSMCGAQTQSIQTEIQTESQSTGAAAAASAVASTLVDIYAELKELRDMVVEQRITLKSTQDELKRMEAENAAMKERLVTSETKVWALESVPKVAFSAALNLGYTQAGATSLDVVFGRVITNFGLAYSSVSGFFTAPVRGVYYFRFTVTDKLNTRKMAIHMHKNGQVVLGLAEYDSDGYFSYLSSGVTLQLEVGDKINLVLPAGMRLYDDGFRYSTFSGFLLFPL